MHFDQLSADRGKRLFWVQPKALQDRYELHAQNQLFATLVFPRTLDQDAVSETAVGKYHLERKGFLNPRVVVSDSGSDSVLATYWPRFWGGGRLEFTGGPTLRWTSANFWETRWGFAGDSKRLMVTIEKGSQKAKLSDMLKEQAIVDIGEAAGAPCELALLITIGWYLMILHTQDAGAGAAAAVAATG